MTFATFMNKVFNNWQAKLLSFGLAVLLYAAFQIISLDSKAFSVPLEVRSEGNFVLAGNAPSTVRVDLRGTAEDIATVQESNIVAFIDISHISETGSEVINVNLELAENLTLMDNLEVSVYPHSLALDIEERTVAWVPVEPRFIGAPLDGYEVLSWTSSISDVRIIGAKSIVDSTQAVYADGIDLSEKIQSFQADANIISVSEKIRIIDADATSIFVEIIPQIITLAYENVIPFSGTLSQDFALAEPLPLAAFEISGEKIPLTDFVPADNMIEFDFSEITEVGEYTLPVITNIPVGLSLNSLNLTEVIVEVIEAPEETEVIDTEAPLAEALTENDIIEGESQ